jgi:hypothetical protein
MSLYSNATVSINNAGSIIPAQYSTRANLPTGSAAYLAFVQDLAIPTVNLGVSYGAGPENGVTWYVFLQKPFDYKNEVILQQGTVGGGYIGSSIWNTISRVNGVTDVLTEMQQTLSFAVNYGAWFSSYQYAYYMGGNSGGTAANRQDWATLTNVTINSQPTSASSPNSSQPGPKTQNTFGVVMSGTSSWWLAFATNTWTSGGYNPSTSQGFGAGSFGQNYGYTYTYGSSVNKISWPTATWTTTSSGNMPNITTSYGKSLNTKLDYWYYAGDVSQGNSFSKYNNNSDTWTYLSGEAYAGQSEQCGIMQQDWGYFVGGYNGTQNAVSQKVIYASNTIILSPSTNGLRSLSSGCPAWGPLP